MGNINRGPVKRLFWDLETSPNVMFSWRAGYKINLSPDNILKERAIICACYKWEGEKDVHAIEWNRGCDKKLVKELLKVASEADEMIAHNGDNFDLKWFHTRCLYHGLDPLPEEKTIDTLVIAKRRFYFNSNRLDYIGKFLFGNGKSDTGGFETWKKICLENCPKAMAVMVKYCKQDVRLLEKVYEELRPYHRDKSHAGVLADLAKWTCPHCASESVHKNKTKVTAAGTKQHGMQCKSCGSYYSINQRTFELYVDAMKEKKKPCSSPS